MNDKVLLPLMPVFRASGVEVIIYRVSKRENHHCKTFKMPVTLNIVHRKLL